ncbi:MAG: hypothetical protein QM724_13390 [Flavobacteriales bacterium]
MAYDATTGRVLVTRANNEFEDPIYTIEFPAYWYYDGMGPAYQNIGVQVQGLSFDATGTTTLPNAKRWFTPGDMLDVGGGTLAWVAEVTDGTVRIVNRTGAPAHGSSMRVLRSGRRNMQDVPMMKLVMMSDPLVALQNNGYDRVLQAQAMEFRDYWRTDCACTEGIGDNVFLDGRSGAWRLARERVWLTQRTYSMRNANTDIRRDGAFRSFSPFYKLQNGRWTIDQAGWTIAREVTQYASNGQVQEERDALGIFSAATYTHGGMLMNVKAANASMKEVGFDSFEASDPPHCADRHFRFTEGSFSVLDGTAHTGRHSLRVEEGQQAVMVSILNNCPHAECDYELMQDTIGGAVRLTAIGTDLPVMFAPMVLEGAPLVVPIVGGGIQVSGSGVWRVRVMATGREGCPQEVELDHE